MAEPPRLRAPLGACSERACGVRRGADDAGELNKGNHRHLLSIQKQGRTRTREEQDGPAGGVLEKVLDAPRGDAVISST